MAYKVELIPEAGDDFDNLDGAVKKQIAKKIDALVENPFLGEPLGNKFGINLTGFYKLYAIKKKYRIAYHLVGDRLEIIEIIAIGKRDKEEVYRLVAKRLKKLVKKQG
jgi:mRNA interferase RelE/StbE